MQLALKHALALVTPDKTVAMGATDRLAIEDVVHSACRSTIEQLVPLTGGGRNEAYRADLASGMSVVVRIGRQPTPWFTDEPITTAQARSVGVPAPEVLAVDTVTIRGELVSFSVLEFVAAQPLDQLAGDLSSVDLQRLIGDAGELLARLHSLSPAIDTTYDLNSPSNEATERAMRAASDVAGKEATLIVDRGVALIRHQVAGQPTPRLALSHGDWLPKHLMIDDRGEIASVIDWEFAGLAPPARDLAHWHASARNGLHEYADVLRRGYRRVSDPDVADEGWGQAFAVHFALEVLGWANPASPERQRRCLEVIVDHIA